MSRPLDATARVAVIGAGSMGAGIAQLAAQAGHEVLMHDAQPGAAQAAIARIAADLEGAVRRERMTSAAAQAVLGRIRAASLEALADCHIAVEAIVEQLDAKQALFRRLEAVLDPAAVLATNTSSISVSAIAHGLDHPERVVGWHFFNPAVRMKLVEIVPGIATDPALLPALHALSRAWGKVPVDAPNTPGFIVNRVARPYYAEGLRLLAEGIAGAPAIDRLLREAGGFAMGPFELMDLIGVEVNLSVTKSVFEATAFDPRYAPHVLQQELVHAGRYGRKSGRGFHDYAPGAAAVPVALVPPGGDGAPLRAAPRAGLLEPLLARLAAAGVPVLPDERLADEFLAVGDTALCLTDGRTAAGRAREEGLGPLVLLDLARDFATTSLLGAAANTAGQPGLVALAARLAPAGIGLLELDDVAGLVVMRIVSCLANEAADVLTWTGTRAADIDTAMRLGTNYPAGPLAWADEIGLARVAGVLQRLQAHYGDVRYRRAPRLSRLHSERGSFHPS